MYAPALLCSPAGLSMVAVQFVHGAGSSSVATSFSGAPRLLVDSNVIPQPGLLLAERGARLPLRTFLDALC